MDDLEVILTIPMMVKALAEEFSERTSHKYMKDGQLTHDTFKTSLGWFVLFDGSRERLYVGREKPKNLNVGDKVLITVFKFKTGQK